jgi:hypothetical protein
VPAVLITLAVVAAVLVVLFALTTGVDFVHIGNSGCAIVHSGFSDMHVKCGHDLVNPTG